MNNQELKEFMLALAEEISRVFYVQRDFVINLSREGDIGKKVPTGALKRALITGIVSPDEIANVIKQTIVNMLSKEKDATKTKIN